MALYLHRGDLPDAIDFGNSVAIDTETMGLRTHRDRLCLIQLSAGDNDAHLVQIPIGHHPKDSPNLRHLLTRSDCTKLFHFARFDLAALQNALDVTVNPVWCSKIASKLVRTFTDRHGLKDLCKELLGVEISKQQQSSDWGAETLSEEQLRYAASDVLYLHRLREKLEIMLVREGRTELANRCFDFLPTRAALDLAGWEECDIFAHS